MKAQYIEIDDIGSKYFAYYSDKKMTILHREGGPAVEFEDGYKEWHIEGKLHREDGPAITNSNGYECWYINGLRHREDGPAIIYGSDNAFDGDKWYIHGKNVTEQEHYLYFNPPKEKSITINGKEFTLKQLAVLIKDSFDKELGVTVSFEADNRGVAQW